MSKRIFIYNPDTCDYEPYRPGRRKQMLKVTLFFLGALTLATSSLWYLSDEFGTPKENSRTATRQDLINKIEMLDQDLDGFYNKLDQITERDESIYRIILEAEPLSSGVRNAGSGGSEKFPEIVQTYLANKEKILIDYLKLDKLKRQLFIQSLSFDELVELAFERNRMWQSIPSIQPVDNKELRRLSTIYGMRFHPILKIVRPHYGLDFMAEIGTQIYATGNGVVKAVYYSDSFGRTVEIDHGYGYITRYAHMSEFLVKKGEQVKRGQAIGLVGNTGLSVSAHLHYEVLKDYQNVNPIGFFQHELDEESYALLLEIAKRETVPLD
jgi:murein DD-endopeptidase MepM/ murein hydrolase activator NlpD